MKPNVKRILSLILAMCAFLTMMANVIPQVNAAALTRTEFDNKLTSAKALYPTGSQKEEWSINGVVVGWQCHGYGRWLSWYVWGVDFANGNGANWILRESTSTTTSINSMVPGDVVRFRRISSSGSLQTWNHTIFVTDIIGNTIYYTDCNSDGNCTIIWGQQIEKSVLESWLKLPLYGSEAADYGYIAHYTPNTLSAGSTRTSDERYASFLPIGTYTLSTGRISVYDETGTLYSNRYIDGATDLCAILEIYTDGWCKVRYPSSAEASGYFNAYVPLSTFTACTSPSSWTATGDYTTYKRSDLGSTMYSVSNGASCLLLQTEGSVRQIIYPVSGQSYSMMGWINDPKQIHVSTSSVSLMLGGTESNVMYAWSTGSYDGTTSLYYSRSNDNISCSWGDWENGKAPLTISALKKGTTILTIGVKDYDTGVVLDSTTVFVTVDAKSYTVSYNANGGSGAPSSQTKYHNTTLTLSSTKPVRTGYTFQGWSTSSSASSASYKPGGSFTANANTTLYAVWQKGCENNTHSYSYKVSKTPTVSATGTLTGTCSKCSGTTSVTLPKLNTTDYAYKVTKAATCTATGTGRYIWKTTTYGSFYFDVSIPATGHNYTGKVTAPTCTAQGYTTYTCSICSNSYKDGYTNATSHSYAYKATTNPTTSATGILTGTCSKCSGTTTVKLPKLTTTDYSYAVTKAATCTATGTGRYTWKTTAYGSFYFDVSIPTTGHSCVGRETAPTCTKQGYMTYYCLNCSFTCVDRYTDATGHSYSYKATTNPTISAAGTLTGTCSKCSGTTTVTLPKLDAANYTYMVTTEPSYTATGTGSYTWNTTSYGIFRFDVTLDKLVAILTRIEVESVPAKTEYTIGENLDTTGLKLKLIYSDDSTKTVTTGFTVSDFSFVDAGTKTMTVTYEDKTTTFNVTVTAPKPEIDEKAPQIIIESKTATNGKDFTVTAEIKNNPGFSYLEVTPVYSSELTLVQVKNGELISDFTKGKQYVWVSDEDVKGDGLLLTFTFRLSEDVEPGSYQVSFNVRTCANYNEDIVTLNVVDGVIEVNDCIYGDVNGDGKVDGFDVIRLKKYLANYDYDAETSIVGVGAGADANGDGKINGFDVIRIKKYLANYDYESGESTIVLGPQ